MLFEIPDLPHQPLGIDDPHLRQERVRVFSFDYADLGTQRVAFGRGGERNDEARRHAQAPQDEHGSAVFSARTILFGANIYSQRAPPQFTFVVKGYAVAIVGLFLNLIPCVEIFLHIATLARQPHRFRNGMTEERRRRMSKGRVPSPGSPPLYQPSHISIPYALLACPLPALAGLARRLILLDICGQTDRRTVGHPPGL